MRLCFNRKNKTLSSIFKQNTVLKMIEDNYNTYCSLHNIMPEAINFKDKVNSVLTDLNLADKRSAKMDLDDFLKLLEGFTRSNIRFC